MRIRLFLRYLLFEIAEHLHPIVRLYFYCCLGSVLASRSGEIEGHDIHGCSRTRIQPCVGLAVRRCRLLLLQSLMLSDSRSLGGEALG